MIRTGSETELNQLFTTLNSVHATIKFECKYSNKEINFLDIIVCISRSTPLFTKLYKKETYRNAYLHYKSYHPSKLKENIPYGQFIRIKRICTNNNDEEDSMNGLNPSLLINKIVDKQNSHMNPLVSPRKHRGKWL